MSKPVILTGLRANNDLTIGNYFGAMLPIIEMASQRAGEYQVNMFIPDLHSFTTPIDHGALYDADERFHRRIVEASAGPRLLALHDAIKPQAERYIRMYISMLTGDIRTSVYEHDIIIAAIDEGRADDAELAVQVNWRHAADRLSKVIALAGERGSW